MKTTKYLIYVLSIVLIVIISACSSDDTVEPDNGNGNNDCDVSNVTFSGDVWPVINSNCKSCHSGTSPSGGIRLEDYDDVKAQGGISAGQPGSLYGAISHNSGNTNMPQNASKLSACTIKKIKAWIDGGMPNN